MKTLSIDSYEQGILIHALNDMRNELISEERPTDAVDDLLIKAMDAKESIVSNDVWKNESNK